LSGTTSTLSPTTLLLTGVIVVLVVLIALVMLRRSKPTGPATTRGLRAGVIYCEQCGAQSPATKQFCEKCGAKLQP
jgi:preprotein translocase subunit SecG